MYSIFVCDYTFIRSRGIKGRRNKKQQQQKEEREKEQKNRKINETKRTRAGAKQFETEKGRVYSERLFMLASSRGKLPAVPGTGPIDPTDRSSELIRKFPDPLARVAASCDGSQSAV